MIIPTDWYWWIPPIAVASFFVGYWRGYERGGKDTEHWCKWMWTKDDLEREIGTE